MPVTICRPCTVFSCYLGSYLSSKGKSRFYIYEFETLKNGVWAAKKPDKIGLFAGYIFFVPFWWRSEWDSNPRYREVQLISSQSRYDHFDIAPCLFPPAILVVSKALKNPLERKAGEKAKKYSIWIFGNPELARVFEGMKFPASAEISSAARYNHFDTLPCINIHLWGLITWFRAI